MRTQPAFMTPLTKTNDMLFIIVVQFLFTSKQIIMKTTITVVAVYPCTSKTVFVLAKDAKGKEVVFQSARTWGWQIGQVRVISCEDLTQDVSYVVPSYKGLFVSKVTPAKAVLTPEQEIAALEAQLAAAKAAAVAKKTA